MGGFVALVRSALGLSQLEFAHLVGWCQSSVTRVENGERDTLFDVRELLRFADAIDMPREALVPLLTGVCPAEVEKTDDMDMDRRQFSGLLAGTVVASMGVQVPKRVDAGHVRYIHASIARFLDQDQQFGGGLLVRSAMRQVARVRAMLDQADYTEAIGRQLLSAAGELSVCAGWLAQDANQQETARGLYGEAHMYAAQAGDLQLHAHVATTAAMQANSMAKTQPGRAREALALASSAREAARHWATPRLHTLMALREALAYANLGDEMAYRKSISTAWREFERGTHEDDLRWLGFVTVGELKYVEGAAAMSLGRPAAVEERFRESMADPESGTRNRLSSHARLSSALLTMGDHHAAYTEGLAVLPRLANSVSSPRAFEHLRPLREAAHHSRSPLAGEFAHAYDELVAV
jgi:transcriptional regulator with XRE-family HTH domain